MPVMWGITYRYLFHFCEQTRLKGDILGKCREVAVERMTDNVVDERQTLCDVFRCPVAEVQVQQTLVTTCTSQTRNNHLANV